MKLHRALSVVNFLERISRLAANTFSNFLHRNAVKAVGRGTKFQRGVWISYPNAITLGRDCLIAHGVIIGAEMKRGKMVLGDRVEVNARSLLDHTGELIIEDDVLISQDVIIYTHDHGLDPRSAAQPRRKRIGKNVWIGARAMILSSCEEIGDGAIVGAGAIVTKNVPCHAIIGGNPARIIRRSSVRSTKETVSTR